MNLQDYILNEIKELSPESKVKRAQKLCKDLPITHVPVVNNGLLLGCISEGDSHTIEDKEAHLGDYQYLFDFFCAPENVNIIELIKLFADNDCNILPVLDKEKKYLGYFELSDILDLFSNSPFLHDEGEFLILEKQKKEFSTSEVTQIVESNQGRVLGLYRSNETVDEVQITLKIDSEDMNEIIQTFRRYNYNVITSHEDDFYLQDLKDRSAYLQKYLDM